MYHSVIIAICVAAAVVGIPLAVVGIRGSLNGLQRVKYEQIRLEHMRQELDRRHKP